MLASAIAAIENEDDRSFIEDVYLRYRELMYRKAMSLLHNSQDAEDAVEAAMFKLIDRVELLRACNRPSLRSYLISCAKNAAVDQLRRAARLYSFDDAQERIERLADESAPDAGLMRAAQAEAVADALARLPERDRELLRMKYYEEMSDREIAPLIGVKPDAVRSYLMRARRKLGAILKEAE